MRTTTDPKIALLQTVPALARARRRRLARLASLLDELHVAPGQVLVREDRSHPELVVVISGTAAVRGDRRPSVTAGPGDVVAHVPADHVHRDHVGAPATVTAETAMRVLVAGPAAVGALLDDDDVRAALLPVAAPPRSTPAVIVAPAAA